MSQTETNITGNVENYIENIKTGDNANFHIGDQYLGYSSVLLRQELFLIPDLHHEIVAPANAESIINTLATTHLVVLFAPPFWRSSYVAEYVAAALRKKVAPNQTDAPIYSLTSEASGAALWDALRDNNNELESAVILASGVLADKYSGNLLSLLAQQAKDRKAYLIITTEDPLQQWRKDKLTQGINENQLIDLVTQSPYTPANLVQWLLNSTELQRWAECGGIQPLTATSAIPDTGLTLQQVATELGSPGALQQFLNAVRGVAVETETLTKIKDLLNEVKAQRDRSAEQRVEAWFDNLDESEKYLVLAISLLDGLQQETFWAIYEQLTQHAWRERDMQLAMTDYHDIEVKLNQFVSATVDRVSFHNAEERRKLVAFALDGYRRSLVQALPVLADIISGANQPVAHETGSLAGRLRVLDIFGSELEPTGENRQRQERLRNSIANSIAQIAQREPSTTQHLLLAWASGVSDPNSDIVNTRLRIAVIITLVQMLTIEAPIPKSTNLKWYERHTAFQLLWQWYNRYSVQQNVAYSQTAIATEERHRNIRGTMALALCHIGRHMTAEDFGLFADSVELTTKVPDEQPKPKDLKSAWDMLLALAWDPDSHVRSSLLEGIPLLAQRHLDYAEALIKMLASDWRSSVRIEVAEMLASLYAQNAASIYITNYLIAHETDIVPRGIPPAANHYLRREAAANQYPYPLHLWTATLTMFFIAQHDAAAFHTYLDTLLQRENEHPALWQAFGDVARFLLSDETLLRQFRDTALLYVLSHTNADKSPARVSQLLAAEIRTFVVHRTIERNTDTFRTWVGALARGRYSPLPEPSITRLRSELSRVEIRNEHIFDLLEHYVSSNEEQVRRRIQHILHVQGSYINTH